MNLSKILKLNNLKVEKSVPNYSASKEFDFVIDKFFADISKTKSFEAFDRVLVKFCKDYKLKPDYDLGMIKLDKGCYIKPGLTNDINNVKIILDHLDSNGIDIAPKFVKAASNGNGASIALLQFPNTETKNLANFVDNRNIVPRSIKDKLYTQLLKLNELGIVNVPILQDNSSLKIAMPSGKVICENWCDLRTPDNYFLNFAPEENIFSLLKHYKDLVYGVRK